MYEKNLQAPTELSLTQGSKALQQTGPSPPQPASSRQLDTFPPFPTVCSPQIPSSPSYLLSSSPSATLPPLPKYSSPPSLLSPSSPPLPPLPQSGSFPPSPEKNWISEGIVPLVRNQGACGEDRLLQVEKVRTSYFLYVFSVVRFFRLY